MHRGILSLCLAFLALGAAHGQAPGSRPRLRPTRLEAPPAIDGVLEPEVWSKVASVTDFDTFIPEFGKRQPERTVAYFAYDRENLYFAFKCYDPHPELIKAALSRRDDVGADDFVCINLDTFNDQQSLYAFYVNPLGIQGDSKFAGNKEDYSIDLVWQSAARIDAEGYTVEMRIPLKSIRYTHADVVRMAVFFERTISRRQEHGSFPSLDPKAGYAFLPQMAILEYEGVARPSVLEVLPSFTYARRATRVDGVMVQEPDKREWGVTAKAGLTSSLVLDATINPDFSQVEADAGQVDTNLRFGLFFAEKRPFFLEGIENFNVGATSNSPLLTLLHTRTIVDPKVGLKLTGKLSSADTVALLHAQDTAPPAAPGQPEGDDPLVRGLRFKHSMKDDGFLGAFYVGRDEGFRHNHVGGADGQLRITPSDLLSFHAFQSALRTDETTPGIRGHALGAEYQRDTSRLAVNAGLHTISDDFTADAGYLTRTGFASGFAGVTPKFYPTSGWVRRWDLGFSASALRDFPSNLTEQDRRISATAVLAGNGSLSLAYDDATEIFVGRRFDTSGLTLSARSQLAKWITVSARHRIGKGIWYDPTDPLQGHGSQTTLQLILQPLASINLTLSRTHADLVRDDTGEKLFNYPISRARLSWQPDEHFFLRAIAQYNGFRQQLLMDYLAAYTYQPGTVVYLGYGTLSEKTEWDAPTGQYRRADHLLEMQRGLFFKASYLWRF
jgi:hypothetical protein